MLLYPGILAVSKQQQQMTDRRKDHLLLTEARYIFINQGHCLHSHTWWLLLLLLPLLVILILLIPVLTLLKLVVLFRLM